MIDDFQRADENPVAYPWVQSAGTSQMKIDSGHLIGTVGVTSTNRSLYTALTVGPGVAEVWGLGGGTTGIGEG